MKRLNWATIRSMSLEHFEDHTHQLLQSFKNYTHFSIIVDAQIISEVSLASEYAAPSHTVEAYTLEGHTQRVLKQFFTQRLFYDISSYIHADSFIWLLALHDIGKNLAVQYAGSKRSQHRYTVEIMKHVLQVSHQENEIPLLTSLINMDPLGAFLKGFTSLEETITTITNGAQQADIKNNYFFQILFLYYLCDASSYDNLKYKVFQEEPSGQLILHPKHSKINEFNQMVNYFKQKE